MKKSFLLACMTLLPALAALPDEETPQTAEDVLAFVQSRLPRKALRLSGTIRVKAKNGYVKAPIPATMEWRRDAVPPTATYRVGNEKSGVVSLTVTWLDGDPQYRFSDPDLKPDAPIFDTGLRWSDLSLGFLWWPDPVLVGHEKKLNRACFVLEIPDPRRADRRRRLWIDRKTGMVLETRTLDAERRTLRRLKIKSIKKIDGLWVAKDLELIDQTTGIRTLLRIADVERPSPRS